MTAQREPGAQPARPQLLLLPGLLCDAAVWQPQCEALSRLADCVVADYGAADSIVAMAHGVLASVPAGRRLALAGHSMGGRVALELVRLAPDRVERLALLDTGYQQRPGGEAGAAEAAQRLALVELARSQGMRAMGERWTQAMVHPRQLGGPVHQAILQMIERFTPDRFAAQQRALLGRPDATRLLPALRVPTLLACGRQDTWSPLARHEDMQRLVPGATLEVIEHSGHMTTMEQPARVAECLADWLLRTG